jgi:hypothetical protein
MKAESGVDPLPFELDRKKTGTKHVAVTCAQLLARYVTHVCVCVRAQFDVSLGD